MYGAMFRVPVLLLLLARVFEARRALDGNNLRSEQKTVKIVTSKSERARNLVEHAAALGEARRALDGKNLRSEKKTLKKVTSKSEDAKRARSLVEHAAALGLSKNKAGSGGKLCHLARTDRAGSAFMNMIQVKAIATLYNMEYIGVYPPGDTESKHPELQRLLGLPAPLDTLPAGVVTVPDLQGFMDVVESQEAPTIFIDLQNIKGQMRLVPEELGALFGSDFRTDLFYHAHFDAPNLWSKDAPLRVAMHIRRGDVLKMKIASRLTPNWWYLKIMDKIRKHVPHAEFVLFSSSPFGNKDGYRLEDFTSQPNVVLRLDQPLEEALSHMAQSDVFIASQSTLAKISGVMNAGLVISQATRGFETLDRWLLTDGTEQSLFTREFEGSLKKGIAKAKRRIGRTG